jgi:hypothetical protein
MKKSIKNNNSSNINFKTIVAVASTTLLSIFSSCSKQSFEGNMEPIVTPTIIENQIDAETTNLEDANILGHLTRAVAYSTPAVGGFTPNSSSSVTITGYSGGVLRVKVLSKTGNTYSLQISKQNGTAFTVAGIAYLRLGSVTGSQLASIAYSAGATTINLNVTVNINNGFSHVFPVVIANNNAGKYYAEPVLFYTIPNSAITTSLGGVNGTVNNVTVYYNGGAVTELYNIVGGVNTGMKWQCVEYVNRYYLQVYGMNIRIAGHHAKDYYPNAAARGLTAIANGAGAPRVGDILCFSGGSGGYGHVMIIVEVAGNYVKVAQQNAGSALPIGFQFTRTGNTINPSALGSGYTCQGWLRKN